MHSQKEEKAGFVRMGMWFPENQYDPFIHIVNHPNLVCLINNQANTVKSGGTKEQQVSYKNELKEIRLSIWALKQSIQIFAFLPVNSSQLGLGIWERKK